MNKDTEYSIKDRFIKKNGTEIKTLILGPSHTFYGVNPKYFNTGTFNLSLQAQGIKVSCELFNGYLAELNNIETLIFSIGWSSFRSFDFLHSTESENHEGYPYYYYNYYMRPNIDCNFEDKFILLNIRHIISRSKRFRDNLSELSCDSLGWKSLESKLDVNNKDKAKTSRVTYGTEAVNCNIEHISQLIQTCKEHDIRFIAITTPNWIDGSTTIINSEEYLEMLKIMDSLQGKYNIEYYNYFEDDRFIQEDFFDGSHLSNIGATKFSIILADTLKL